MNASNPARSARSVGHLLLLLLGLFLATPSLAGKPSVPTSDGRTVVVGFDGADARTVQRLMDEGRLPNLERLAEEGTFAPLVSTNPAESAAGWAALNTGTNPLKNNVPSFIKRQVSEGSVGAGLGHIATRTMTVDELEPQGLLALYLNYEAWQLALAVGLGALVLFFVLFKFVLRANGALAGVLSVIIGGAGAYAALQPADWLPTEVPSVFTNNVSQKGFWDYAAEAGKRATVLDAALAFGRPETPGARVLAGLGLPDVRGAGNGNWFIYTTDDLEMYRPPQGYLLSKGKTGTGTIFRVDEKAGRIETQVFGPVNFMAKLPIEARIADLEAQLAKKGLGWKESGVLRDEKAKVMAELDSIRLEPWEHRAKLDLVMERQGDELAITIAGQTHKAAEGAWTDWFKLPFELSRLVKAGGITRARVMSLNDPLTVYFHTFDIDPESPPFWQPVSSPPGFSAQLADWTGGSFETLGWSCMTNQIKDEALPIEAFLEDIEFTMGWRERMAYACLERDDWDVLFAVFSTTDRVQHMMYRYHDPEHPLHDPAEAAREVEFFGRKTALGDVVPAIYEQMDRVVGEILSRLDPDDQLFLCADHGFTSYRYGLEVNNWLAQEGYLVYDEPSSSGSKYLAAVVDWSKTRAYALGLGMVYLNLEGREPAGIVPKAEAKALLKEIGDKLVALTDSGPEDAPFATPRSVALDYSIMDELYSGGEHEWGDLDWPCADMQIGLDEYYRASWTSTSGKIRFVKDEAGDPVLAPIFRDNNNNWSGDHASNSPNLVTGIFFSRKPVEVPADGVSVMHLAPTVLDALGVAVPSHMDLGPLKFR
jgi:predicted AlkP superfamily phosphohydrolase/phosphomutase